MARENRRVSNGAQYLGVTAAALNAPVSRRGTGSVPHKRACLKEGNDLDSCFVLVCDHMRLWLKTTLFLSAFSPCLFSIAIAKAWANGISWTFFYYIIAGLAGCLTITYVIAAIEWYGEAFPFSVKKIEPNDTLFLGVVSTYFLPFLGKGAEITVPEVMALSCAIALVLYVSNAIAPSPLMGLLGYRFYKAESANGFVYTLITRRELTDPTQVKTVKRITPSMLLEIFK